MTIFFGRYHPTYGPHRSSYAYSNGVDREICNGRLLGFGLVDLVATLDFESNESFVRCFSLPTRKSEVRARGRLDNGQRVISSVVREISFEQARHEFQRNFYVVPD
jgi:hypothetical protein